MREWLGGNWMYAGSVMAVVLFALAPLLGWSLPELLVYLQLPIYMVHQVEEHSGDRFRREVNRNLFGGVEALTTEMVVFVNLGLVWVLFLAGMVLMRFDALAWGLLSTYIVLVNAVLHVVVAVVQRRYNPGLISAVGLFLPLGVWTLRVLPALESAQWLALGFAVGMHVALVVWIKTRAIRLRAEQA